MARENREANIARRKTEKRCRRIGSKNGHDRRYSNGCWFETRNRISYFEHKDTAIMANTQINCDFRHTEAQKEAFFWGDGCLQGGDVFFGGREERFLAYRSDF